MKLPAIRGLIERRILVNFRVDPELLTKLLPTRFRPMIVNGYGMAGICLIRLKQIRPGFLPSVFGLTSENAAHRFAVEWEQDGEKKHGVFIPRRDTSSWLNTLLGGHIFPGLQHHANFHVQEDDDHYRIDLTSDDRQAHVLVDGCRSQEFTMDSVFGSLDEASQFFELGSVGYSATSKPDEFDGLELHSLNWNVQPLELSEVRSSFFDDRDRFPSGSIEFDSALLMRGIQHEWRGKETLGSCCTGVS